MSLLTIIQKVARQTRLFSAPGTVIGNNDPFVEQAQELLFEIGEELKESADWEFLVKEQTFNTVSSQAAYVINTIVTDNDWDSFIGNTMWDRTNRREVKIEDYRTWQFLQSSVGTSAGIDKTVTQFGDDLNIFPTPGSVDTLVFFYKSAFWIKSSGGTGQSDWLDDTDTSFFSEYLLQLGLRYKILQADGLPYEDQLGNFNRRTDAELEKNKPKQTIYKPFFNRIPIANIPDSGFGT